MRQKIFLTTLGLLAVVSSYFFPTKAPYIPSKKQIAANQIRSKVAKRLEKEKNLVPFGSGGAMFYEVTMLGLAFQYYQVVSLEEARELLTYAVQTFLEEINANEDIRPYLIQYPFKAENIELQIWIQNPDRSDVAKDQLFFIACEDNGCLNYFLDTPGNQSYKTTLHKETFEEAVEILNKAKSPRSSGPSQAGSTPTTTLSPAKQVFK